VLAASLLLLYATLGLQENPLVPIGPGFYPRIVLGVTAVLALALVVADLLRAKKPRRAEARSYSMVVAMFAAFGLYAGALPYLGFRISTLLYIGAVNGMLAPPRGAPGWLRVAVLALVATIVVYAVFERYLLVLLPRGRWTNF